MVAFKKCEFCGGWFVNLKAHEAAYKGRTCKKYSLREGANTALKLSEEPA